MNLPRNAAPQAAMLASPVVELRQYTLNPGQRETLIALFDREFIESQEATGMTVIGQFSDLDRPDMFVWLRGFDSMDVRKEALAAFYDGRVWTAHRDAANATMIDSDDVLLLKPAWPGAGFDLSRLQRPASAEQENSSNENRLGGIVVIRIHHLRSEAETEFASRFAVEAAPMMKAHGVRLLAAFVTEHAQNSFPRLPVRASENVFLSIARFDDTEAHASQEAALAAAPAWQAFWQTAHLDLAKPIETLRLSPTSRSLVGR